MSVINPQIVADVLQKANDDIKFASKSFDAKISEIKKEEVNMEREARRALEKRASDKLLKNIQHGNL